MTDWNAQIVRIANVGQDKMCRLWLEIPQEHAQAFIVEFGWPTFVDPVPVKITSQSATEDKSQRETPSHEMAKLDKPLETTPPGVHNPYSRWAGILANDKRFWNYIGTENIPDKACYAASWIRLRCGVTSRKDILPGTEAAKLFDELKNRFTGWCNGLEPGGIQQADKAAGVPAVGRPM